MMERKAEEVSSSRILVTLLSNPEYPRSSGKLINYLIRRKFRSEGVSAIPP